MELPDSAAIRVGKLGQFAFPAGWYVYVGSARGPGGLAARVSRHCKASKVLRWHVDYLRAYAKPVAVWYAIGDQKHECDWARLLVAISDGPGSPQGFGASDCRCSTHLAHFMTRPSIATFAPILDEDVWINAVEV